MEIEYAFLARGAETAPDGTLSAFGAGFERLRSPTLPHFAQFAVVAHVRGISEDKELVTGFLEGDIFNPDGKSVLDIPINSIVQLGRLPDAGSRIADESVNLVIQLSGIPLAVTGKHRVWFRFRIDKQVAEHSLPLVVEVRNG